MSDRAEIRGLLLPHKSYAAYALAQLGPNLFGLSDWYTSSGDGGSALLVHSRSGLGRALIAIGDPASLAAVLSIHPGPHFTFGSLRPEHRSVIERYFVMTREQTMLRMAISAESFTAVEGQAVRLRGKDARQINRLYSSEGGPTAYSPRHIEDGVYHGVLENDRLIAIAGTHVVSASEGVAVVGNVFTHPRYRGLGHSTVATSAATAELLKSCALVVLTVEADNEPAVSVYERLGYKTECTLYETPLIRKEPLGVLSLARRLAAGWRGRGDGTEIVDL
jgi:RimJ/RimL family protein N-acetyltransferase